jgi:hypothetical protein
VSNLGDEKRNFKSYRKLIAERAPLNDRSYYRGWYRNAEPVQKDFSLDEIEEIIRSGDTISLRELSRYYYRTNSNYRNNIDFLAHLPLYDTAVIPVYQEGKGSET